MTNYGFDPGHIRETRHSRSNTVLTLQRILPWTGISSVGFVVVGAHMMTGVQTIGGCRMPDGIKMQRFMATLLVDQNIYDNPFPIRLNQKYDRLIMSSNGSAYFFGTGPISALHMLENGEAKLREFCDESLQLCDEDFVRQSLVDLRVLAINHAECTGQNGIKALRKHKH